MKFLSLLFLLLCWNNYSYAATYCKTEYSLPNNYGLVTCKSADGMDDEFKKNAATKICSKYAAKLDISKSRQVYNEDEDLFTFQCEDKIIRALNAKNTELKALQDKEKAVIQEKEDIKLAKDKCFSLGYEKDSLKFKSCVMELIR
jgi:hypothetical protein